MGDCGLPGANTVTSTSYGNLPTVSYYAISCSQQSGASFSVSCSPTATFTGQIGTNGSVAGEAKVSGGANAFPITLSIGGTKPDSSGNPDVLTGQQMTATISGIPTNFTVTKYTWSGVSATCFKNYNEQAASNQLTPLGDADKSDTATGNSTVPSLAFYDSAAESLTITCAVTLTAPDGVSTVTLTATAPAITVKKPTAYWTTSPGDPTLGPAFDQTQMGYDEKWDAAITVPAPFVGIGQGCFAQIVYPTADFQRSPLNNQPINCYLEVPQQNADGSTSYVLPTTGLDTHFPYQNSLTTNYPQGYIWDVSGAGQSGDSPRAGFGTAAADNGGNNWYNIFASDTFTTWLMYKPSGGVWVPLQRVDWHWTGSVVKDSATGKWNSSTSGNPPVTGSTSDPGIPVDTPPQWTSVNAGSMVLHP